MSEEVVVTASTPTASAVAPAVPAATPALKGGMLPGESFAQAMQRNGGFDPPSAQAKAPEQPAEAAVAKGKAAKKEVAKAAKAAAAAVEAAPAAALESIDENAALAFIEKLQGDLPQKTLTALAKKLGLDVDGARVTAKERIEFREQKRKHAERMQREEQDLIQRFTQAKGGLEGEINKARAIFKAKEDGNYEALARELGAKDWNALQEEVIARLSDPNYKRMLELEQREQQREQQARRAQQEFEQRQQQQAKAVAMQEHARNLSEHMKASRDPLVAAMHDDPLFINSVIEVQRQNWDGSTTVTPEQAIKIAAKGFTAPLAQTMRTLYERLSRVYGAQQATAILEQPEAQAAVAAAVEAAEPQGKGKKNKTSGAAAPTGGAPAPARKFSNRKEADEHFTRELQKAIAADRR